MQDIVKQNAHLLDQSPLHHALWLKSLKLSLQLLQHQYFHHPGSWRKMKMIVDWRWSLPFEGLEWLSWLQGCCDICRWFPPQVLSEAQVRYLLCYSEMDLIDLVRCWSIQWLLPPMEKGAQDYPRIHGPTLLEALLWKKADEGQVAWKVSATILLSFYHTSSKSSLTLSKEKNMNMVLATNLYLTHNVWYNTKVISYSACRELGVKQ